MKKIKSKSLGQGFLRHLRILETCEQAAIKMNGLSVDDSYKFFLKDLGGPISKVFLAMGDDPNADKFLRAVVERWANDAADLRESFKFQVKDLNLLMSGSLPAVEFLMPFEKTTLVVHVNNPENSNQVIDLVFYVELRNTKEDYNDLNAGDPFYSITTSMHSTAQNYEGIFPFELHIPAGQMIPEVINGKRSDRIAEQGIDLISYLGVPETLPEDQMDEMHKIQQLAELQVSRFIQLLALPDLRKTVSPGLRPNVRHIAKRKKKYPMYEHTTLEIDVHPDQSDAERKFTIEGRHHRLHPVRGHWRSLKSGKRSWVPPHWRGDDELGVVTHDYELKEDA